MNAATKLRTESANYCTISVSLYVFENSHSLDMTDLDPSQVLSTEDDSFEIQSISDTEAELNGIFDELEPPSTPKLAIPSGVAPEHYIYPDPVTTTPLMKYLFKFIIFNPKSSFVQHFTKVDSAEFDKLIPGAETADIEHDIATFQQNWPRGPPLTGWIQYMRCLDIRWRHLRRGERALNLNDPMIKEEKTDMKEWLRKEQQSPSYIQELEAKAKRESDYADKLFGPPMQLIQVGGQPAVALVQKKRNSMELKPEESKRMKASVS